MINLRIDFEYDGSSFFGYQKQKTGERTIQGTLEKSLKDIFGQEVKTIASGRTDRGVHAKGQVANFVVNNKIPVDRLKEIINRKLPRDIFIRKLQIVDEEFNSRFDAQKRIYKYFIKKMENYTVYDRNYCTYYDVDIDVEKLKTIFKFYEGRHDFESYRKSDCGAKTSIREIYSTNVEKVDDKIVITIEGNAFLKSMVRIMVGTAVSVVSGKNSVDYLKEKLDNPDKNSPKILAPPEGLYLYSVEY